MNWVSPGSFGWRFWKRQWLDILGLLDLQSWFVYWRDSLVWLGVWYLAAYSSRRGNRRVLLIFWSGPRSIGLFVLLRGWSRPGSY